MAETEKILTIPVCRAAATPFRRERMHDTPDLEF